MGPIGHWCVSFRHFWNHSLGCIGLHVLSAIGHPKRYEIRVPIPDPWTLHRIDSTRYQSVERRPAAIAQSHHLNHCICGGGDHFYRAFNPLSGIYATLMMRVCRRLGRHFIIPYLSPDFPELRDIPLFSIGKKQTQFSHEKWWIISGYRHAPESFLI